MEIFELQSQDMALWDEYVSRSKHAIVFHLAGWKEVMKVSFGLTPRYIFAADLDRITGVLPLFYVKNSISGDYYTSMPGAMCADDEETARALVGHATGLVKASNSKYLILRDSHQKWDLPGLARSDDHCYLTTRLSSDLELVWSQINREERRLIRNAIAEGVEVETKPENITEFYPVYLKAMRERGTPPFGVEFFRQAWEQYPENFTLQTVRYENQILAGGFVAHFKDTVYCTWAGVLKRYYEYRPSHLLFWNAMKFGSKNGYQFVDFGRSQCGSGSYKFKLNFGAQPQSLYQYYFLNGNLLPPAVGNGWANDAKYRQFVRIWRRLPLSVVDFLGPKLRKRMPFG